MGGSAVPGIFRIPPARRADEAFFLSGTEKSPCIGQILITEDEKGIPMVKISSPEEQKAVPVELVSVGEYFFALREEKKAIREECFCFPEQAP